MKCHICKAKNRQEICKRCNAKLSIPLTEQLVLLSGRFTYMDYNDRKYRKLASCKVALTNQRIVIYKIKPEPLNPAFGLFNDVLYIFKKRLCISIKLRDIEYVKRYGEKHLIVTKTESYGVCLNNYKKWDMLLQKL